MKSKVVMAIALGAIFLFVAFVRVTPLADGRLRAAEAAEAGHSHSAAEKQQIPPRQNKPKTGEMSVGKLFGQVTYDPNQDYYFLELRGVRFPFKSSPIEAQDVLLEAQGKADLQKNTSLLYGILGKEVLYAKLLIDPNEEDEVMPAVTDIARYIQIANRTKYAGIVYTKPGGKLERSVTKGSQIQALTDATAKTPIVLLKGPKSGAKKTRVSALGDGKVLVEGQTYADLYKAADRICITLIKMLCGSSDCPDAAACATGGSCGCG